MKFTKSKLRRFLPMLLIIMPCLLLLVMLKVAHERSHLVKTEEFDVQGIFFSRDERSVCTAVELPGSNDEPHYNCWDRSTSINLSSLQLDRVLSPHTKKYGSLWLQDDIAGNVLYCVGSDSACSDQTKFHSAWVAYSSDGQHLTLAQNDGVSQWDLKSGTRLWNTLLIPPKGDDCGREIVALSPDGAMCAAVETCGYQEKYQILDCQSGRIIAQASPVQWSMREDYFFTSDSHTLVVWTEKQMSFFDAHTAKPLWNLKIGFDAFDTTFFVAPRRAPNGLVGIPRKGGFDFFDARTGNVTRHLRQPALPEMVTWNFSPDGKQLWWATTQNQTFWCDLT